MKINYKSDFDFLLRINDVQGADIGFPEFDFSVVLSTSGKTFKASCIGGVCRNCFNDNGHIRIVCDSHGLLPGRLKVTFFANRDNDLYPDGKQLTVTPIDGDMELVTGVGTAQADDVMVTAMLPIVTVSAYQLALIAGYQGSQDEFNAYLATLPQAVDDARAATIAADNAAGNANKKALLAVNAAARADDAANRAETDNELMNERVSALEKFSKTVKPLNDSSYICGGIISINAMPGNVYRSKGKIKVGTTRGERLTQYNYIHRFNIHGNADFERLCSDFGLNSAEEIASHLSTRDYCDTYLRTMWDNRDVVYTDDYIEWDADKAHCIIYLNIPDGFVRKNVDGSFTFAEHPMGKIDFVPQPPTAKEIASCLIAADRTGEGRFAWIGKIGRNQQNSSRRSYDWIAHKRHNFKIKIEVLKHKRSVFRHPYNVKTRTPLHKVWVPLSWSNYGRGLFRARKRTKAGISKWVYFIISQNFVCENGGGVGC